MSLTDEIYHELMDGLERGLDWEQILAKYRASKGPLYNALGRVLVEIQAKITALNEERNWVQNELDQARLKLDSLNQQKKEEESNIVSLEDRKNVLSEQVETLEAKLAEKSELTKHLVELGRLGFDSEKLKQLQEALSEIGAKHGLKGKEAVNKFFNDLKDYELVLGAEFRLKGLQTQIETKEIEAENWQAREEALRRKHDDLAEAIAVVLALRAKGIKKEHIVTWHRILSRFETVEQFDQSLTQYSDMTGLLKARKEKIENCELKLTQVKSQVETSEKERARIEGAIDALKAAGVKELTTMNKEAAEQLKTAADTVINEIQAVGREVRMEFNDFFNRLDASIKKVFEIGQEYERMMQKLQKYEGVKDTLESHTASSEEENDVPKQS